MGKTTDTQTQADTGSDTTGAPAPAPAPSPAAAPAAQAKEPVPPGDHAWTGDEFHGQYGTFVFDPATGKRTRVPEPE